jgi:hypothetical protein
MIKDVSAQRDERTEDSPCRFQDHENDSHGYERTCPGSSLEDYKADPGGWLKGLYERCARKLKEAGWTMPE